MDRGPPATESSGQRSALNRVHNVGWMPCDCLGAMAEPGRGHPWVHCRTEGCGSIWYRPAHGWPQDSQCLAVCARHSGATFCLVARYKVTFDMPLRPAAGERAMAIAGRLQDRLQATGAHGMTGPEVATYRIRRGRLRGVTVAMIIQAGDAARALAIAMDALLEAMGTDSRSWDVPGTGATVAPVLTAMPSAGGRKRS